MNTPRRHDVPLEERIIGFHLRRRRDESADRRFLVVGERTWTFREADSDARAFARGLQREGINRGDHVVLMLPNCAEFVLAWFGISLIGAVTIPIDPRQSGTLLEYKLGDARPRCLVIARELLPALATVTADSMASVACLVIVDGMNADLEPQAQLPAAAAPRRIAWADALVAEGPDPEVVADYRDINMVMYTSGSSGPAKGVLMPNAHTFSSGLAMLRAVDLRDHDVLFTPFPLFHGMASRIGVLPALVAGVPVVVGERFSASAYWEQAHACKATIGIVVPTISKLLMAQPPGKFDRGHRVRAMFNSKPDAGFEERFGTELIESYGMTEISQVISAPYAERRTGSCGRVQAYWDVKLLGEDGVEVPQGEIGEIVARPQLPGIMMAGYLNKPEETARALRDGWFHTADFGYFDAEGYFFFTGRAAERIRRLGENISAQQIERIVESHPAVAEAAALPYPSPLGEDDVRLILSLKDGAALTAEALYVWMAEKLPRFMLPRYIEFLARLPRTESGKVAKIALIGTALGAAAWNSGEASRRAPMGATSSVGR